MHSRQGNFVGTNNFCSVFSSLYHYYLTRRRTYVGRRVDAALTYSRLYLPLALARVQLLACMLPSAIGVLHWTVEKSVWPTCVSAFSRYVTLSHTAGRWPRTINCS
jgi:hypothetical protein